MSETRNATQLVKKHKIGLFLKNESDKFVRIKKSTSLTLSMNPQEEEYDYIADESPTTELVDYKPSIDQDLVMYAGEPDYEMMWNYIYELRTGSDAHTDCMVVFMHRPVDGKGNNIPVGDTETKAAGYRAWLTDSIISIQDMNATEKKLNFKVLFGGGITHGIVTVNEEEGPVFIPKSMWKVPEENLTPDPGGTTLPDSGDNSGMDPEDSSEKTPEATPGTDQGETPEAETGDEQETDFNESEGE
ncbi:MAG: hypothetical protein NC307_13220 [Roseburia sp.]|nr:hypothetical protein [Roseburia sp.]